MFYKDLAEIAGQLNQNDLDIDGVLKALCMRKFANHMFFASFFLGIEQDGRLMVKGHFGAKPEEIGLAEGSVSIFDDHPAAESIRVDSIVCAQSPVVTTTTLRPSLIAWPVAGQNHTLGSLVTITDYQCSEADEYKEYLEALMSLVNGTLVRRLEVNGISNPAKSTKASIQPESLTERQEVILKLISEGRTNGDIAQILGYSESLIRQETIKIYAVLKCNGRQEAAMIYLEKFGAASNSR